MKKNLLKILILVEWYHPIGGLESFVWQLTKELSEKHKICLVIQHFGKKQIIKPPNKNVKIIDISKNLILTIDKIIQKEKPDIIHTNHVSKIGIAGIKVAKKYKIPILLTHHQIPEYKARYSYKLINPVLWKYYKWADNKVDLITTPSQTVAKKVKEKGITKEIKMISCGVNTKRFMPDNKKEAKKELNLPQKPIILFVGRFGKDKNLDLLIKAASKIVKNIDVQFVLLGFKVIKGDASTLIKSLIEKLKLKNNFTLMNFIHHSSEKLPKVYKSADLFVIPSVFETQSIVTLEAMASGLPIVASNSGALPELVANEKNGYLFEKENYNDLARKVIKILNNKKLQEKMSKNSRKLALKHDLSKTIKAYEDIYYDLVERY